MKLHIDMSDYPIVLNDEHDRVLATIPDPNDQIDPRLRLTDEESIRNAKVFAQAFEMAEVIRDVVAKYETKWQGSMGIGPSFIPEYVGNLRAILARIDGN